MDQELLITNNMKKLGFSEYESKAYLKLLEEFPLNGYALSKNSGIPRSRIYEVLKNLINKQLVFEQEEEKNKLYYPVDPDIVVRKLKTQYEELFDGISKFASRVYKEKKQDDRLVVIKGRQNIVDFLNMLIKGAENRIAISIWEEEIKDLTLELEKAITRGVVLRGIYFGENNPFESLVPHRRIKRYMAEKKERYISIIIDGSHTISGIVSRGEDSKVTWTRDEGFIEISEDYIAHDLLVNLYSASLDDEGYKEFEEFADNVHDQYFHYTSEELKIYKRLK
jgi:HTH-type transcriptional regulator, sugar sensing transcriptional regulator